MDVPGYADILSGIERPGFLKDLVLDADLTDVMKECSIFQDF